MENNETANNLELLKRKLSKDIKPILFTGAGFSYNAPNGNGDILPLGNELKNRIISEVLSLDISIGTGAELSNYPLDKVYGYALAENEGQLIAFMMTLFSNVKALEHQKIISNFPWQKIYTLNIDDLIENATSLRINPVNSSKPLPNNIKNSIDYIKLHGCVRNKDGGFIFSHNEYINKLSGPLDHRFAKLTEDLQTQDFVCIGNSGDEPDITYYLMRFGIGNDKRYGNLFIVNPSPSIIFKQDIKKSGAKLIEMDCEEFANWLIDNANILQKSTRHNQSQYFKRNFLNVNNIQGYYTTYDNSDTKLYLGDHPKWEDIVAQYDFRTLFEKKIFAEIQRLIEDTTENIVCTLLSKAIGGKSVQLKRLGMMFVEQGYDVYEYIGNELKSREFISGASETENNIIVLLVDDASGYYNTIAQILNRFPIEKRLIVICASRPYFHYKKYYDIRYLPTYKCFNLDDMDINHLEYMSKSAIRTLKDKGLLGKIKGKSDEEKLKFFIRKADITEALWEIFEGSNLRKRYETAYSSLIALNEKGDTTSLSKLTYKTIIGLAIFNERELPFMPNALLVRLLGNNLSNVENRIVDIVKQVNMNGISLRTNMLTSLIISSASEQDKIEVIRDILQIVSSYIVGSRDSYWHQIQSRLMNVVFLKRVLKLKPQKIKELFNKLLRFYEEDENYFIQLGRIEQEMGKYELALNHFIQADIHSPNLYTVRNAIARNYLKQSYDDQLLKSEDAAKCYSKGKKLMVDLIEERETYQVKAYSIHSLVIETIKYWSARHIMPSKEEVTELFKYLKDAISEFEGDPRIYGVNKYFMSFIKRKNLQSMLPKLDFVDLKLVNQLFSQEEKEMFEEDDELE